MKKPETGSTGSVRAGESAHVKRIDVVPSKDGKQVDLRFHLADHKGFWVSLAPVDARAVVNAINGILDDQIRVEIEG